MIEKLKLGRRQFLAASAGTMALPAAGLSMLPGMAAAQAATALPAYVGAKDIDALIIHSNNTIETKRAAMGTQPITPESHFFVRNNISPPDASILDDRDAWQITIQGVGAERTLTLGELKRIATRTIASVIQCSGNGRIYFEHAPGGTKWDVGAAGCAFWTGVPLRALVDHLGGDIAADAVFITGTGGEEIAANVDRLAMLVERSVPLEALDDIILAWDMNGAPISLAHGGPLRMIVPGYSGVNNIKYINNLAFTAEQSPAVIQQRRYRTHPIGTEGAPDYPSIWQMAVKSWITGPTETTTAGLTQITGLAFGGAEELAKVEVSIDDGATWQEAELIGPDLGKFAWRAFVLPVELAAGDYRLVSRATSISGAVQPEMPESNDAGYNHNGWRDPGVALTIA